ncbi:MAG TPA: hypothetical protein VD999_00445 [Vitreimonas sp.]|nr:hypothetical protein [Vitreimonas sp.]
MITTENSATFFLNPEHSNSYLREISQLMVTANLEEFSHFLTTLCEIRQENNQPVVGFSHEHTMSTFNNAHSHEVQHLKHMEQIIHLKFFIQEFANCANIMIGYAGMWPDFSDGEKVSFAPMINKYLSRLVVALPQLNHILTFVDAQHLVEFYKEAPLSQFSVDHFLQLNSIRELQGNVTQTAKSIIKSLSVISSNEAEIDQEKVAIVLAQAEQIVNWAESSIEQIDLSKKYNEIVLLSGRKKAQRIERQRAEKESKNAQN